MHVEKEREFVCVCVCVCVIESEHKFSCWFTSGPPTYCWPQLFSFKLLSVWNRQRANQSEKRELLLWVIHVEDDINQASWRPKLHNTSIHSFGLTLSVCSVNNNEPIRLA